MVRNDPEGVGGLWHEVLEGDGVLLDGATVGPSVQLPLVLV